MGRLDELDILVAIVETGSLTGAARRLGRSAPAITRGLAALEKRVGLGLIERTTRSLAPTDAGRDLANPASLIGSAAMLFTWLGERRGDQRLIHASELIEDALDQVIARPEWRTADLGGPLGTRAFAEHVAAAVEE